MGLAMEGTTLSDSAIIRLAISNRIASCEERGYQPTRVVVGTDASRALATVLPTTSPSRGCG